MKALILPGLCKSLEYYRNLIDMLASEYHMLVSYYAYREKTDKSLLDKFTANLATYLNSCDFDLIIADGIGFQRLIRALPTLQRIPQIFCLNPIYGGIPYMDALSNHPSFIYAILTWCKTNENITYELSKKLIFSEIIPSYVYTDFANIDSDKIVSAVLEAINSYRRFAVPNIKLLITGDNDILLPDKQRVFIEHDCNCRLTSLPYCGHFCLIDNPIAVFDEIRDAMSVRALPAASSF